jgi:hypothetical protein
MQVELKLGFLDWAAEICMYNDLKTKLDDTV